MTILFAALLTGCTARKYTSPDYLQAQVWREHCPGSDPVETWIRLRPDGIFDYSYESPSAGWEDGDDETWTLSGGSLMVSWNDGYATSTYNLKRVEDDRVPGLSSKSCGDRITLEKL